MLGCDFIFDGIEQERRGDDLKISPCVWRSRTTFFRKCICKVKYANRGKTAFMTSVVDIFLIFGNKNCAAWFLLCGA